MTEVVVKLAKLVKPDCLFASSAALLSERLIIRTNETGSELKMHLGATFRLTIDDTMYYGKRQPRRTGTRHRSLPQIIHPAGGPNAKTATVHGIDVDTQLWKAATLATALGDWIKPIVAFAASESTLSSALEQWNVLFVLFSTEVMSLAFYH